MPDTTPKPHPKRYANGEYPPAVSIHHSNPYNPTTDLERYTTAVFDKSQLDTLRNYYISTGDKENLALLNQHQDALLKGHNAGGRTSSVPLGLRKEFADAHNATIFEDAQLYADLNKKVDAQLKKQAVIDKININRMQWAGDKIDRMAVPIEGTQTAQSTVRPQTVERPYPLATTQRGELAIRPSAEITPYQYALGARVAGPTVSPTANGTVINAYRNPFTGEYSPSFLGDAMGQVSRYGKPVMKVVNKVAEPLMIGLNAVDAVQRRNNYIEQLYGSYPELQKGHHPIRDDVIGRLVGAGAGIEAGLNTASFGVYDYAKDYATSPEGTESYKNMQQGLSYFPTPLGY